MTPAEMQRLAAAVLGMVAEDEKLMRAAVRRYAGEVPGFTAVDEDDLVTFLALDARIRVEGIPR